MSKGDQSVLADYRLLMIEGIEAADFLHGLLTSDVKGLETGSGSRSALLTPQGKIISLGWLFYETPERFVYCLPEGTADACFQALKRYRLRRKIDLEPDIKRSLVIASEPKGDLAFSLLPDQKWGVGTILAAEGAQVYESQEARNWWSYRLRELGLFTLGIDLLPDSAFPHDIGLDDQGGLAKAKGCYIGQEVVSRMMHRETLSRRPVVIKPLSGTLDEQGGDLIASGGALIGVCYGALKEIGLAVVRLDRLAASLAKNEIITLKGQSVLCTPPLSEIDQSDFWG